MNNNLTLIEKQLIDLIQIDFPITPGPFEEIGKILNTDENTVIDLIKKLKAENIIRQISAIYNTKKLGFTSTLAAFEVSKDKIDDTAKYVCTHPGVSHCYKRSNKLNLWFTIAAPQDIDLDSQIKKMADKYKITRFYSFPNKKMFKRKVFFKLSDRDYKDCKFNHDYTSYKIINESLKNDLMACLNNDLIISAAPFEDMAKKYDLLESDIMSFIYQLKNEKIITRFSAIIKYQNIGFNNNAMVVWDIPPDTVESFGLEAAKYDEVSHCYKRKSYDDWHYNLYTMIHGNNETSCLKIIDYLKTKFSINNFLILFSEKEYKKQRIDYFSKNFKLFN